MVAAVVVVAASMMMKKSWLGIVCSEYPMSSDFDHQCLPIRMVTILKGGVGAAAAAASLD